MISSCSPRVLCILPDTSLTPNAQGVCCRKCGLYCNNRELFCDTFSLLTRSRVHVDHNTNPAIKYQCCPALPTFEPHAATSRAEAWGGKLTSRRRYPRSCCDGGNTARHAPLSVRSNAVVSVLRQIPAFFGQTLAGELRFVPEM